MFEMRKGEELNGSIQLVPEKHPVEEDTFLWCLLLLSINPLRNSRIQSWQTPKLRLNNTLRRQGRS